MAHISLALVALAGVFLTAAWRTADQDSLYALTPTTQPVAGAPAEGGAPVETRAAAQEFAIDAGHSSAMFRVMHLGVTPFWGRFNRLEGRFRVDPESPDESFIEVSIPAASIDTNSGNRDKHLKSPDFFNAAEHPNLTFKSSKVEATGEDRFRVTGVLEIRGKAKEIKIDVEHVATRDAGDRFGLRSGYETRFTIDRTDFGVNYGVDSGALGKDVELIIALEGMVKK